MSPVVCQNLGRSLTRLPICRQNRLTAPHTQALQVTGATYSAASSTDTNAPRPDDRISAPTRSLTASLLPAARRRSFLVQPEMVLRWHRNLVCVVGPTKAGGQDGRH